jgi:hypothetical protein
MEDIILKIKGPNLTGTLYKVLNFNNGVAQIKRSELTENVFEIVHHAKWKVTTDDGKPFTELPKRYSQQKKNIEVHKEESKKRREEKN